MTTFQEFDASKYLDTEQAIAEYLAAALEDRNPDVFIASRGHLEESRGGVV